MDTEIYFEERVQNFVTFIEGPGAEYHILPAQGEASPRDWEQHQGKSIDWLEHLAEPLAIFATNDQLAMRFRKVNRLLRNTNLTLDAIPEMTGFSYSHYSPKRPIAIATERHQAPSGKKAARGEP